MQKFDTAIAGILDLSKVMAPIEEAEGLPNPFYIDDKVFGAERQRLFFDTWACIGFAKDLVEPGCQRPLDFLGVPLFAVRDQAGELRVFQNVCRHRGMTLVEQPTCARVIRCPYHCWTYGLDGSLRATPHVGGPDIKHHPRIDPAERSLLEVRSTVWMDMIFVNLSGDAPDFATHVGKLSGRWREFMERPIYPGGDDSSFSLEVDCNWKLAVENYCESYHLPFVHPGLNSYSRLEDHYHIMEELAFSGQGTTVYDPKLDAEGRRFATFEGLSAKWDRGAEYIALYPNVLLGVHKDHFYSIRLHPLGIDRCREEVEIYYTDPEMLSPEWADLRRRNAEAWKEIFVEDVGVVEGMQKGRHAPGFDGGVFSPVMDGPTHTFHHWVASSFQPH